MADGLFRACKAVRVIAFEPRATELSAQWQCKICLKSPCTSISASSAVLVVQGLLRHILVSLFTFVRWHLNLALCLPKLYPACAAIY